MFGIFKRKKAAGEVTFKTRVQLFWEWYAQMGPRFLETIDAGKCPDLAPEVSRKIDELLPGFAWVFGPGANRVGHSFTLSGEGDIHRQLLTIHWHSQAPQLPGWTFYPARQPDGIAGKRIKMGAQEFNPVEFWLTPVVNRERECIDVTVWHPLFSKMQDQQKWTVLFLFLDEILGEYGTGQWLGDIKLGSHQLADSIPIEELSEFLAKVEAETGWKKLPPGSSMSLYRFSEPRDGFLRGDIVIGTTANTKLVNQYLEANGQMDDPLADTGADYVFIAFDASFLPQGQEVAARGEIEDSLEAALRPESSGRLLGGALGRQNAYIDLLIYDGAESLRLIEQVIREKGLPSGTSINYFAHSKRGHRIVL